MVTTRENDWHPAANGVPWMQKTRPGLRSARQVRRVPSSALPPAPDPSPDPATAERTKPTDVRKQRLLREAHEIEGGDSANAGNDFALIVVAVLVLAIYWGAAAIVAGSAMNRQGDAGPQVFPTQKVPQSPGNAAAQAGTQNRTAHDTNHAIYTDRGSR